MTLNIKNDETQRLSRELAELTGESITTAVTVARRERDGLLVVEQQRRQFRPGVEPVAAVGTLGGPDRVATLTKAVDVAQRPPGADLHHRRDHPARWACRHPA